MTTKPYDRNNNDTYVEKFSDNIVADVEIHMYRNEKGSSIAGSGIRGNFSVESRIAAQNNVLKFPTATQLGITKIKDIKVDNFIPMTLVQRYNHSEEKLTIHHKTPIFYDQKIDKFVLMLDHRFIRDISISELNIKDNSIYKIYKDKKNKDFKYIGLLFSTVPEITETKNTDNSFSLFLEAYKFYKMSLQGGEKVIVLKFASSENKHVTLFQFESKKLLGNGLTTRQFDFEYAVFVRFGNRYYFCDNEGNIIQNSSIYIDKKKEQQNIDSKMLSKLTDLAFYSRGQGEDNNIFIVPYSEEQLKIIENISKKLHSIHNELCELFNKSTDAESSFDFPVLSISNDSSDLIKRLSSD